MGDSPEKGCEVGSSGSRAPPGAQGCAALSKTDSITVRFWSHLHAAQGDGREAGTAGGRGSTGERWGWPRPGCWAAGVGGGEMGEKFRESEAPGQLRTEEGAGQEDCRFLVWSELFGSKVLSQRE